MTTTILITNISEVDNKILDTKSLVTTADLNKTICKVEKKISDHAKYIITQEFNRLTAENFAARSKQANLVSKADFDNSFNSFKL